MEIKATKPFFIGAETPWEEVGPGLKRQIMGYDEHIMLVKVNFDEGAVGVLHEHYHSQVTYVESGEFEMKIDGETRVLKAGDAFYVVPHVWHGCVCTKPGVLLDVFSPAREDFLGYPMKKSR
jgi:quercetin dioxygenase-like cupin family protein